MNKRVVFNMNEIKNMYVVQQVENKQMTGTQAAEQLSLSYGRNVD